jgi:hypothetical protein
MGQALGNGQKEEKSRNSLKEELTRDDDTQNLYT